MSYLIFLVFFVTLAIFIGILFKNIVLKDYPKEERKGQEAISMVLFIAATVLIYSVIFAGFSINSAIKKYSLELETYVYENHSDIEFVKTGIDMRTVNEDISRINNAVAELNTTLRPYANELGIPGWAYNWAVRNIQTQLEVRLLIVNAAGNAANVFADENNYITVSSLLNGFRVGFMKVLNTIILIIVIIFVLILGIYILVTLSTVSKEKKKLKTDGNPSLVPGL